MFHEKQMLTNTQASSTTQVLALAPWSVSQHVQTPVAWPAPQCRTLLGTLENDWIIIREAWLYSVCKIGFP